MNVPHKTRASIQIGDTGFFQVLGSLEGFLRLQRLHITEGVFFTRLPFYFSLKNKDIGTPEKLNFFRKSFSKNRLKLSGTCFG